MENNNQPLNTEEKLELEMDKVIELEQEPIKINNMKILYIVSVFINLFGALVSLVSGELSVYLFAMLALGLIHLYLLRQEKNMYGHISVLSFLILLLAFLYLFLRPHNGPGTLGLAVGLIYLVTIIYSISIISGIIGIVIASKKKI